LSESLAVFSVDFKGAEVAAKVAGTGILDVCCFAASRAFFLATRGSPFWVTRSLMVRLRPVGTMPRASEVEKDIPGRFLDGWIECVLDTVQDGMNRLRL
jgi:hypothetical protein